MTDKIKILHVTYHMGIGGTEQVIYQLVNNADKNIFDNSIVCIAGEIGAIGQKLQETGTGFHVLKRTPGFDTDLIKSIKGIMRREKIDIVHCHQYTPYVYGVIAALFCTTKVVFTEHGRFHPDSYSWKRRLVNPLLDVATAATVAISAATKDALSSFEWFRKNKIQVIYNGIESTPADSQIKQPNNLGLSDSNLVFGTITRFDTIKNLPMMINAFSKVHAQHPHARLLLVGDGDERKVTEELVTQLGINDAVIFTGFQTDTKKYMALIDIYILSSFSEGTSMTLLEAMSFSKCCIVTAVGGNVEIINDQVNGFVVESNNTDQLASTMLSLIDNQELQQQMGSAAKNTFDAKFDLNQMIQSYKSIYQSALNIQPPTQ